MLTVALAATLVVAGAAVWAWRHAERELTAAEERADFHEARAREAERERDRLARRVRHQCERIDGYRAELDALSIAGPTVEQRAIAALNNNAPQDTLSDAWLTYVDSLPTTYDREYPR